MKGQRSRVKCEGVSVDVQGNLGSASIPAPVSPSRLPEVMNPLRYCCDKHLETGAGLVQMGESPETCHISPQSQNNSEITRA